MFGSTGSTVFLIDFLFCVLFFCQSNNNQILLIISRSFAVTHVRAILKQNCKLQFEYSFKLDHFDIFSTTTLYKWRFVFHQSKSNRICNLSIIFPCLLASALTTIFDKHREKLVKKLQINYELIIPSAVNSSCGFYTSRISLVASRISN